MNNLKRNYIILIFLLCIGCKKICPDEFNSYDNKCYKYENKTPTIEYYCGRGGILQDKYCIITEEYECLQTKNKETCTNITKYLANKEYKCPDGYDLNGNKCSKIVYLK